jgi:hypothetical protein
MTPTVRTTESYDSNPLLGIGETLEIAKQGSLGAISHNLQNAHYHFRTNRGLFGVPGSRNKDQCMPANSDLNAE